LAEKEVKRALAILNPRAGSGRWEEARGILVETFERHGWRLIVAEHSPHGEDDAGITRALAQLIREAREQDAELVIAVGGDGTASMTAQALIESGHGRAMRLGLFPAGTANVLAQEVGMPLEWPAAAERLAAAPGAAPLDAMRVGRRHFFLRIGIGLDAETIRDTDTQSKKRLGAWAYFWALLKRVATPRRHRFACLVDGRRKRFRAVQVFAANGGRIALAPFRLGPGIDPGDGIVNLCAYDAASWRDFVVLAWGLFRGRYRSELPMKCWPARSRIVIATHRPQAVQADGEPWGTTPIEIAVVPQALRVVSE
jgi:diacylglycerol kinase (ATP)